MRIVRTIMLVMDCQAILATSGLSDGSLISITRAGQAIR